MLKLDNCIVRNGTFTLSADLTVEQNCKAAVVGPSGAGKSTLLEAIAGFRELSAGRVLWGDTDLTSQAPGKRPIAMLFQDSNLFPHMTVQHNVALGIRTTGKLNKDQAGQVQSALDRVGLAGMANRKPAELSGGQQSRAALARVLVQQHEILLLDEPFSALGPALKAEMLDLVSALVDETGATLLMVSHDPDDAKRIASHIILVADDQASPPSPTSELFTNPPAALRDYLLGE